jgi:Rrf2 family transcriptional regulator, iron-sulfur cluster assembly transcription factor
MNMSMMARSAVRVSLDLALHYDKGPRRVTDLENELHMSQSYIEKLLSLLKPKDLIRAVRGPGGGYSLSRSPGEIRLGEIVIAVDRASHSSRRKDHDATTPLWTDLEDLYFEVLNRITLDDVVHRRKVNVTLKKSRPRCLI